MFFQYSFKTPLSTLYWSNWIIHNTSKKCFYRKY